MSLQTLLQLQLHVTANTTTAVTSLRSRSVALVRRSWGDGMGITLKIFSQNSDTEIPWLWVGAGADPGGGLGGCNPLFFRRRQGKSAESEPSHALRRYATHHAGSSKHATYVRTDHHSQRARTGRSAPLEKPGVSAHVRAS